MPIGAARSGPPVLGKAPPGAAAGWPAPPAVADEIPQAFGFRLSPAVCLAYMVRLAPVASSVQTSCAIPHGSVAIIWKSARFRLPPVTRHSVPARQMSAACIGFTPLTRLWVNVGCPDIAFTLWANISDHCACGSLLSWASEPYHEMAIRPSDPAVIQGKTLAPSPPESTCTGLTRPFEPLGTVSS